MAVDELGGKAGGANVLYIDGSGYEAGGAKYAGWSVWPPEEQVLCMKGPRKVRR